MVFLVFAMVTGTVVEQLTQIVYVRLVIVWEIGLCGARARMV